MYKKISILYICLASFLFGCKKDNSHTTSTPSIIGHWDLNLLNVKEYKNSVKTSDGNFSYAGGGDYLEFKKDGTGTYSQPGFHNGLPSKPNDITYTLSGKTLTLTFLPDPSADLLYLSPYTVLSVSSSELKLYREEQKTIQGSDTTQRIFEYQYAAGKTN